MWWVLAHVLTTTFLFTWRLKKWQKRKQKKKKQQRKRKHPRRKNRQLIISNYHKAIIADALVALFFFA